MAREDSNLAIHARPVHHPHTMSVAGAERQVIDRYAIERRIGAGGFGTVYLARHSILGTEVALKTLSPLLSERPEVVQRFLREAKAAAAIGDPHIVQVHDAGVFEGIPFLAMELLRGEDLEQRIARGGALPIDLALAIVTQVLEGLSAAHTRGIVHRDMKPANVFLLASDGPVPFVKLLDFGVSKIVDPKEVARLTQTGVALGTPAYMAPEQVLSARDVDARADLFAVAVILFEALSGKLPYAADSLADLVSRFAGRESTRLDAYFPEAPPELVELIARGLANEPSQRFQSATEMIRALEDVRRRGPFPSVRPLATSPFATVSAGKETPPPSYGLATPPPSYGLATPPPSYGLATPQPAPWSSVATPSPRPMVAAPHYAPPAVPRAEPPRRSSGLMWMLAAALVLVGCLASGTALVLFASGDGDPTGPSAGKPPESGSVPGKPPSQAGGPEPNDPEDVIPPGIGSLLDLPMDPSDLNIPGAPQREPSEPQLVPIAAGADPCTIPVTHDVACLIGESIHVPEQCTVRDGAELHVLGMLSAEEQRPVRVDVMRTAAPIVLVLASTAAARWEVHLAEGARLRRIILSGLERSTVEGQPADVPVDWRSGAGGRYPPNGFEWSATGQAPDLARAAERETGLALRAYAGCVSPSRFVIGQRAP
jgi:serine/threonine protein kinase